MKAWALHTDVGLEEVNLHLAELEAAGLLGIVERDGQATVYLPARRDGLSLAGRWEPVPERDWSSAWKEGLQPVTVGPLRIAPPWLAGPGDVVIDPGQAFGTGHHETTTGCVQALTQLDLRGRQVLDVGTGTGILAICATRLGAAEVVAVDTDPIAVAAATGNAARNRVRVTVRQGSVEAAAGAFDVVVANLDTATVCRLAKSLAAAVRVGGALIVSGISIERTAQAAAALQAAGVPVRGRRGREWSVLTATIAEDGGYADPRAGA